MSLNTTNSLLDIPNPLPVKVAFDTRTSWDIIRSCLATLFACLWISVHPNMSPPSHSDVRIFFTKVELMLWTLLFPEMILLWAFRQWKGARILSKKFKKYEWVMSHGFFVQMGGFVLRREDGSTDVLFGDYLLEWISAHGRVPNITAQQISGRSKGDGFSKAIVIAQTSWFVAQCVTRHIKGLFITPAELSTLAYAVLNGGMYFLWWHKPLDCRTPVELRPSYTDYPIDAFYLCPTHEFSTVQFRSSRESRTHVPTSQSETETRPEPEESVVVNSAEPELQNVVSTTTDPEALVSATNAPLQLVPKSIRHSLWKILVFPYQRLASMRNRSTYFTRASMFYAYATSTGYHHIRKNSFWEHVLLMFVCLIFGGVHLLAWSSHFSSHTEHFLWRACSVAITALPMIYGFPILFLRVALPARSSDS
ncbi:hypothetical protein D9613_008815 [Agrocybe pediades]|uniref:Uncharacterized protein n=1 Tax=Agrocybe pediades TaxID=84607 RepID=A0A8H4VQJ5_9AGAR|nr:hypothetical protein D9613_008815 [Agrocybe pediades]